MALTLRALRASLIPSLKSAVCATRFASTQSNLLISKDDANGFTTLSMNRPKVNTLNREFLTEITEALTKLEEDGSSGVILTSNLNSFSGGLELSEFCTSDEQSLRSFWRSFQDLWMKLFGLAIPSACAITGHAPAGGCVLATCCDYRAMVEGKFVIGLNEAAFGLVPPMFVIDSFRNTLLSDRHVERALTTGKLYGVREAYEIGLIDDVATDQDDAMKRCRDALAVWSKGSPSARHRTKMMLRGKFIDRLRREQEDDLNDIVKYVMNDAFQNHIGAYLKSISERKK